MKLDVEMGQRVDQSGRRKREPDDDTCQQVDRDDADDGRQVDPEHTPTAFQELSRGGKRPQITIVARSIANSKGLSAARPHAT
jgi:hypothetical protein